MIGIFDSGLGGLSVFREIRKLLPEESYIYFADSANCPYGEKTKEFITDRARQIAEFMIDKGAEIIVVACNTATAAAISTLRKEYEIPFIGMEPAVKPAAAKTKSGVVGVLATASTLKADKYINTRGLYATDVRFVEHVGEGFVELVESGQMRGPMAEATIYRSIQPLLEAGADTIVLGCTHYPFLSETILKVASEHMPSQQICLIDPAPAVARHVLEIMEAEGLVRKDGFKIMLHSSGDETLLQNLYDKLG